MLNVYKLLLELSVFLFSLLVYMMLFFFFPDVECGSGF